MLVSRTVKVLSVGIGFVVVVGVSLPVQAAIIGASGNAVVSDVIGADLSNGNAEGTGIVTGFIEQQGVTISAPLNVNFLVSESDIGQQFDGTNNAASGPLALESGTFNSTLLHFDPVGENGGQLSDATFTFSGDIVAIITRTDLLEASDAVFGVASAFSSLNSRQTEGNDQFTLLASDTIRLDSFGVVNGFVDEFRVITTADSSAAVPEPLTIIGSAVALGMGAVARRRQKAS